LLQSSSDDFLYEAAISIADGLLGKMQDLSLNLHLALLCNSRRGMNSPTHK
jgi:hypothetical protein